MTNADTIRNMSENELARAILDFQCERCDYCGVCKDETKCEEKILAWLKQDN